MDVVGFALRDGLESGKCLVRDTKDQPLVPAQLGGGRCLLSPLRSKQYENVGLDMTG